MASLIGFTLTAIVFFYLGWKAKAKKDKIELKELRIMKRVMSMRGH